MQFERRLGSVKGITGVSKKGSVGESSPREVDILWYARKSVDRSLIERSFYGAMTSAERRY